MILLTALLALLAAAPAASAPPARTVAVTFDDLPCNPQEGATPAEQVAINRAIVRTLVERGIPAVGFVNEVRLEQGGRADPARVAAIEIWLAAGLELGNHTYSHPSLHRTPVADYLKDVVKGETVTRELLCARGKPLRWFRHPFLHTGRDLATRQEVEAFLAAREMAVAPVTIDNAEWIFARAYLRAGRGRERKRIAAAYLAYMEAKTDYWERQSVALFGREIPQVLLVHGNRLNADHFARLARNLERRGYRFVTLEEAVSDEAYRSQDTFTGGAGISWLHRWALTRGGPALLVPDEPKAPQWILDAAGVEGE